MTRRGFVGSVTRGLGSRGSSAAPDRFGRRADHFNGRRRARGLAGRDGRGAAGSRTRAVPVALAVADAGRVHGRVVRLQAGRAGQARRHPRLRSRRQRGLVRPAHVPAGRERGHQLEPPCARDPPLPRHTRPGRGPGAADVRRDRLLRQQQRPAPAPRLREIRRPHRRADLVDVRGRRQHAQHDRLRVADRLPLAPPGAGALDVQGGRERSVVARGRGQQVVDPDARGHLRQGGVPDAGPGLALRVRRRAPPPVRRGLPRQGPLPSDGGPDGRRDALGRQPVGEGEDVRPRLHLLAVHLRRGRRSLPRGRDRRARPERQTCSPSGSPRSWAATSTSGRTR